MPNPRVLPPSSSAATRRHFLRFLALGSAALVLPRGRAASPSGRKLGVALVGLGGYATNQLAPALRQTKFCELTAVVTGTPEKAARWKRDHQLAESCVYDYESMEEMADNRAIDVVYIVTPPGLHAEQTIRAARAGKHVICEKPMANSVAECEAMIAACREAKVHLSIGYRLHYDPIHGELRRLARERDFGPFTRIAGGNGFRLGARTWRVDKKLAGGGPLMDMGIYVIQAACSAKEEAAPIAVTARAPAPTRPDVFDQVEESLHWTMEFADGAVAEGYTSFGENVARFRADAADGWFELAPAFSYRGIRGATSRGPLDFPSINQQAAQMDGMAQAIMENRPSAAPGEMGRRDLAIIEAIYKAAATGERVPVKL
jgi:glucose-fructose oxidoreductase